MPVLVKRWRSVAICVKSLSAGEPGNLTELAPEVLNSKALQSRNSQAAITSRCTAVVLAIGIDEQRGKKPWLKIIAILRYLRFAAPRLLHLCIFKPDLGSKSVLLPGAGGC